MVILASPDIVMPGNDYVEKSFARRDLPEDAFKAYIAKYKEYFETEVFPRMSMYAWCSKQCYIGLANIMTCAASMGIDSCPMEGFEKEWVEKVLEVDTSPFEVAVIVALGYRKGGQTPRQRHVLEEIVEYM